MWGNKDKKNQFLTGQHCFAGATIMCKIAGKLGLKRNYKNGGWRSDFLLIHRPPYLTKTIKPWFPILTLGSGFHCWSRLRRSVDGHRVQWPRQLTLAPLPELSQRGTPDPTPSVQRHQLVAFRVRKLLMVHTAKLLNVFSPWIFHYKNEFKEHKGEPHFQGFILLLERIQYLASASCWR